jgi:serine-type D-Ala-D-Ala carboxypeptidase (penicillin-binding protein 5/6)
VRSRVAAAFAAGVLALVALPAGAAAAKPLPRPQVRAASYAVIDARTGEVLLDRAGNARRAIASTTKLMTALLALERARPREVFTAPAYRALPVESKINLRKGERMTVEDLLEGLLLESANDAAVTIAENVSGSRAAFVRDMNARARELGLERTRFANAIGLDDPDNYSTARDLAALAARLMRIRRFERIVDLPEAVLASGSRRRVVDNRNLLIARYPFVDGVKTGHTRSAGYVLVGSGTGRDVRVITVVLGEPSESARDSDTVALLRWGIDQFRRERVLTRGATVAKVAVKWRGDETARLTTPATVALTVRRGERVMRQLDAPGEVEGPLARGERVGSAQVVYRGKVVRRVPLVTADDVPGAGLPRRLTSALGPLLTLLLALAALGGVALVALRVRATRVKRARMTAGSR